MSDDDKTVYLHDVIRDVKSVGGLEVAMDWYAADGCDRGPAEMPYPPDHPEMPGEPMRVQSSRARNKPEDAAPS